MLLVIETLGGFGLDDGLVDAIGLKLVEITLKIVLLSLPY